MLLPNPPKPNGLETTPNRTSHKHTMKERIEKLKAELREFLELSKTITPGKWEVKEDLTAACGYHFVNTASSPLGTIVTARKEDATFIARSRNISPAMAECLLNTIEYIQADADAFHPNAPRGQASRFQLQQILTIWEVKP